MDEQNNSFQDDRPQAVSPGISDRAPQPARPLHDLLSVVSVLASALLLAFFIISFIFQSYQVDGPSMQTTLENNDHLIVWKVPRTIASLTGGSYVPHRGNVIIFNKELDGVKEQLIKRVIALPGERLVVNDGQVTVYNKEHPEGFLPDRSQPYGKVISFTPGNEDITLGKDQIFVMGDHRDNSRDSRDFGPITPKDIVGKLVLRVLPLDDVTRF